MALNPLIIEGTEVTPTVVLDKDTNTFLFKGKSLPENPAAFFKPIMKWIDDFALEPSIEFNVEFHMIYFNTSSSKMFLDIMKKFELISHSGCRVAIKWYYAEDDEEILESGEIYGERVDISFETIMETE